MEKIIFVIIIFCSMAYGWDTWSPAAETHTKVTRDVIDDLIASDYPDLVLYKTVISNGSDYESHDVPDQSSEEVWMPNYELWFDSPFQGGGALQHYNFIDIENAYKLIGYEIHLVGDETAPPHQKKCFHGPERLDMFELKAIVPGNHGYLFSSTYSYWFFSMTFNFWNRNDNSYTLCTETFCYWLSDDMDDDNRDEQPDSMGGDNIIDGPQNKGLPAYQWGSYGKPSIPNGSEDQQNNYDNYDERLPGLNEGMDHGANANVNLIKEQLGQAFLLTDTALKNRSKALPPLIPIIAPYGSPPSISPSIFGPHTSPATLTFTVMENRKPDVKTTILCGGTAITEVDSGEFTNGKTYDGDDESVITLGSGAVLPWKSEVNIPWRGKLASGTISDGTHTLTIQVEDHDTNKSEMRSVSVKYDATAPTGTISVEGI